MKTIIVVFICTHCFLATGLVRPCTGLPPTPPSPSLLLSWKTLPFCFFPILEKDFLQPDFMPFCAMQFLVNCTLHYASTRLHFFHLVWIDGNDFLEKRKRHSVRGNQNVRSILSHGLFFVRWGRCIRSQCRMQEVLITMWPNMYMYIK